MESIEGLIAEFRWLHEEHIVDSIEGVEVVQQFFDREMKSLEMALYSALIEEMHAIIRDKHCVDCGDFITDENRPGYDTYFGPDSGYCATCAASHEYGDALEQDDYFYVEDAEVYVYFDMDNQSWAWALYIDDVAETYSYGYDSRDEAAEEGECQTRDFLAQRNDNRSVLLIDDVASYKEDV